MCDDIQATLAGLRGKGVEIAQDVSDQGWGLLAAIRLPDGWSSVSTSRGTRCRPGPERAELTGTASPRPRRGGGSRW